MSNQENRTVFTSSGLRVEDNRNGFVMACAGLRYLIPQILPS